MQQPHGPSAHIHPAFLPALTAISGEAQVVPHPRVAANDERAAGFRAMCAEAQGMADEIKARGAAKARAAAAARPAPAPARVLHSTVATEAEYRAALAVHDWHFERSDDHGVWTAGVNSLGRLQAMRKRLDTDGAIWNEYAPVEFRLGLLAGSAA
ncbi:hypothetical protein [Xenophilus sp. Marseille-Q4582]|uniref:hypothetical protein n=1 Tax=Xenophilus sp. Marseille-Q4582 TaxID=2866600 RepID=UPI001CE43701|nr:hypothetical protein [Xenophilus sp. Marseille-Q4582]